MLKQNYRLIIGSVLLVLLAVPATHSADLLCYECENCAKIDASLEPIVCNADHFNPPGSTEASTVTTTTTQSTEESSLSSESTTEISTTTTSDSSTESSSSSSSTDPTSTDSTTTVETTTTEKAIPTPETAGPVETTTGLPTPPTADVLISALNSTTELPASRRLRRAAAVAAADGFTYHCYSVQRNNNGTMETDRGCSRVDTEEGVCPDLKRENPEIELNTCRACSMNRCNGSSALNISVVTLIVATIAGLLSRN